MRRVFVILVTALALIATSCGAQTVTAGEEALPTAVPAPTVAGEIIENDEPAAPAEIVLIGLSSEDVVDIRALPGLDQPAAGDVAAGTRIEKMTEEFKTEDGLVWWQVRAGAVQGWIQPNVAYLGPLQDVTEAVTAVLDPDVLYTSAEEAAREIGNRVAAEQGATDVIIVGTTTIEGQNSTTVTADLLGLPTGQVVGFRLLISSSAATGWRPVSILQFPLCTTGVTPEGSCLG